MIKILKLILIIIIVIISASCVTINNSLTNIKNQLSNKKIAFLVYKDMANCVTNYGLKLYNEYFENMLKTLSESSFLERQYIDSFLDEYKFEYENVDLTEINKIGRMLSADFIAYGSYSMNSEFTILTTRISNVKTGQVIWSKSIQLKYTQEDLEQSKKIILVSNKIVNKVVPIKIENIKLNKNKDFDKFSEPDLYLNIKINGKIAFEKIHIDEVIDFWISTDNIYEIELYDDDLLKDDYIDSFFIEKLEIIELDLTKSIILKSKNYNVLKLIFLI